MQGTTCACHVYVLLTSYSLIVYIFHYMQHKTDQHWRRAPTLPVVEAALKTSENLRGDSERVGCAEVNDTACLHWLAHVYIVINNVSLRGDKVSVWHDDSVVLAFCPTVVK